MPIYTYECEVCAGQREVVQSMKDPHKRFVHCHRRMFRIIQAPGFSFKKTPGKETGVYALDYGRRATEDLTVPGKFERLIKDGRIKMPDPVKRKPPDMKMIQETFGDATKAEKKALRRKITGNRSEI